MRVTVIIPHFQDLAGLDRCLTALKQQTYPSTDFEIIVADNGSPVGEAAVAECIAGRAKLVIASERGAGMARNAGAAAASGEILAFVDSDCVPDPEWLEAGMAAVANGDIAGGQVRVLVDDPSRPTPTEAFESVFAFNFEDYILKKGFTGSGNMFVWSTIFRDVGGFRNGVSEDVEWSHRARALGYNIAYAPAAIVGHPARRNWPELKRKWRRLASEQFELKRARPAGSLRWLILTWVTPLSALVHLPKVMVDPRLPTIGSRLGALAILFRIRAWRFIEGNRLLLRRES